MILAVPSCRRQPSAPRAERGHARADERVRDDDVAVLEQRRVVVHTACTASDVRLDVGEEQQLVLRRLPHVDEDRKRVVLDDHELRSVHSGRAIIAENDRHDVADEADDLLGDERPPQPLLEDGNRRRAIRRVEVGAGKTSMFGGPLPPQMRRFR